MAHFALVPLEPKALTSIGLAHEARQHEGNPTLEAYKVWIEGEAEPAECLYFGDRDIAGIAWGADATWIEQVSSAQEACEQEFGDMA
jgi:hypothetical protein